jgi:hypothetical protein
MCAKQPWATLSFYTIICRVAARAPLALCPFGIMTTDLSTNVSRMSFIRILFTGDLTDQHSV